MKIFIIGPEGSGKTVLLAMLSRFVATERKDLVMEPMDFPASKNVVSALATLEKKEWPQSTRQGMPEVFKWRFGKVGQVLHDLEMADFAGQDIRQILLADNALRLPAELDEIRRNINEADILVFLLDLEGLLDSKDLSRLNENAWLFKAFLEKPEWHNKHRMVVISKADRFEDLLVNLVAGKTPDLEIKTIIKQYLPQNFSINHLVDLEATVSYLAVSSVETTTSIEANGDPLLRPVTPLKAIGMEGFVDGLIERIEKCITSPRPSPVPPPKLPLPPKIGAGSVALGSPSDVMPVAVFRFFGENVVALNSIALCGLIGTFFCSVLGFISGCFIGWVVGLGIRNEKSIKAIFRTIPPIRHLWIGCLAMTLLYGVLHIQNQVTCDKCEGTGQIGIIFKDSCPKCNGTGKVNIYWWQQ